MPDPFVRMALLYGSAAMERLQHARVAVFGIGGVGGYAVEALARSGIGALDLIDHDNGRISFDAASFGYYYGYDEQLKNKGVRFYKLPEGFSSILRKISWISG